MTATLAQLQEDLDDLESRMPTMVRASATTEFFLPDCVPREILLLDAAAKDDYPWAAGRLREMLRQHSAPALD
ncbi:hypothetical protein [Dyella sp.]|jgi:hypothetical protein|uniref:hypothetical protein n=1 Tax=Dyella sp. TaxID=1869338 RepID=UPI002D77BCDC|nr:hypothetical protein [Dyella sp.]HET6432658.1 hypothetical protein [Dyella sp.]